MAHFDGSASRIDVSCSDTMPVRSSSMSDPQAYREHLFALLGDRDPLEVMAETASTLGDIVSTHSTTVLRSRPFEGRWTPNEIIGHLTDGEWVYGYRLRLIFSEDTPAILGMNQDLWVARQQHNEREPSELVETFRTLRELNLAASKRLLPSDLKRTGRHNERGPESLSVMLRMLAGHDVSHLNQIARYIQAVDVEPCS
jgi:DinB family protein